MSKNQLHGLMFENEVRHKLNLRHPVSATDVFDIPLVVTTKIAGSIKTSKLENETDLTIHLSDATRVWSWGDIIDYCSCTEGHPKVRLVIGAYTQVGNIKRIVTVYDLNIELTDTIKRLLYGQITTADVYAFHLGLRREFFPDAEVASKWASNMKKQLSSIGGAIQLNYKVDSKSQRRLQCTIKLSELKLILPYAAIKQETKNYNGIALPFDISSSQRERNKNKNNTAN
jgi:hypothetical protein